jgi:hypothetical protein
MRKYFIQGGRFPAVDMRMSIMATAVTAMQRTENQNTPWETKPTSFLLYLKIWWRNLIIDRSGGLLPTLICTERVGKAKKAAEAVLFS